MKDMRREVSVLPVEYLAIDIFVHALANQVLVATILQELTLLIRTEVSVRLHLHPFSLGVAVLLLRIVGYVVYWIVQLLTVLVPSDWIRSSLEQINQEVADVIVVLWLLWL